MNIALARIWINSKRESYDNIPSLAFACLRAYLRQHGYDADVREVVAEAPDDFGRRTYRDVYNTFEAPLLPLLLAAADVLLQRPVGEPDLLADDAFVVAAHEYCTRFELGWDAWSASFAERQALAFATARELARYQIVGLSVFYSNLLESALIALRLRIENPEAVLVFGGPHVTQSEGVRELLLRLGVCDAIVVGEGEATLLALVQRLDANPRAGIADILGLASCRPGSEEITFAPRPPIPALEVLPVPDWRALPPSPDGAPRTLPHFASRGCVARCAFCSEWHLHGPRYRHKPALKVARELCELQDSYDVLHFEFHDSMLNASSSFLRELSLELDGTGRTMQWGGFIRASIEPETVTLGRRAGWRRASLGIESFYDETLGAMNKQRTSVQNLDAIRMLLDHEIYTHLDVIVGFPKPSLSRAAFHEELRHIERLCNEIQQRTNWRGLVRFGVFRFDVRPGSLIAYRPERFGVQLVRWDPAQLRSPLAQRCRSSIAKISKEFTTGLTPLELMYRIDAIATYVLPVSLPAPRYSPFDPALLQAYQQRRAK